MDLWVEQTPTPDPSSIVVCTSISENVIFLGTCVVLVSAYFPPTTAIIL